MCDYIPNFLEKGFLVLLQIILQIRFFLLLRLIIIFFGLHKVGGRQKYTISSCD